MLSSSSQTFKVRAKLVTELVRNCFESVLFADSLQDRFYRIGSQRVYVLEAFDMLYTPRATTPLRSV